MSMPPNIPQSPYGGPAFPPPPPHKKKQNPLLVGCLGCGGLLVALTVLGAVVSAVSANKSTTATPPTTSPSPVASSAGHTTPTKAHTTTQKPPPPPQPRTVLTESGNGMKTTKTFKVHGDWDLYYSFNCANFGGQGNFMVGNDATGDMYVNSLAASGKDATHQHNGDGATALSIDSECNWRIKVVQLP